jgi:hypothetical protein
VTELHLGGLLDKVEGGFAPHGRRYKSDVSTPRVKRCRDKKRNASLAQGNVSVDISGKVLETAPEAESEADTEQSARARKWGLGKEGGEPASWDRHALCRPILNGVGTGYPKALPKCRF